MRTTKTVRKNARKTRKSVSRLLALLCCFSLLIGSFAFFTDRETAQTNAVAGNMDLVFNDISSSKSGDNKIISNNEFAVDQSWLNGIVAEEKIINPGDYFDLSYELINNGSKSMDVRQQLIVTSNVPMTDGAEEYTLTFLNEDGSEIATIEGKLSDDGLSITYDLPDIILDGSIETEDDASDGKYIVRLDFAQSAGNAFMNSSVGVTYQAQAKQHRNTTEGDFVAWGEVSTKFEQVDNTPGIYMPAEVMKGTSTDYMKFAGQTYKLRGKPEGGEWSSSNTSVASVSDEGEVTAHNAGTTDISYTTSDTSFTVSVEVVDYTEVNVSKADGEYIGYSDTVTDLVIPAVYNKDGKWYKVVGIAREGFKSCKNLQSVTIPDSVTKIYAYAFDICTNLQSVTIPDSVTFIDTCAFKSCKNLQSVTIPDSVTTLGGLVFNQCDSLTSVTVPGSVTYIGKSVFSQCDNLTSVTLCTGLTSIGESMFNSCTSLTSVTIPDSVTTIGDSAFNGCSSLTSVMIPDSVTTICDGAFANTKLTSVTIPDSVTTIGNYAFNGCSSLTSVTIPSSLTTISESMFSSCSNLESVTIPDSVTTIGDSAFANCRNLTSVTIPDSVTTIGNSTFYGCTNLESVTIPDSVTSMGTQVFWQCKNLQSVTIPSGITSIPYGTFYECTKLKSVTIPNTVTMVDQYSFYGASYANITFEGTTEQCKAIQFIGGWNSGYNSRTVTCTGDENGNGAGTVSIGYSNP